VHLRLAQVAIHEQHPSVKMHLADDSEVDGRGGLPLVRERACHRDRSERPLRRDRIEARPKVPILLRHKRIGHEHCDAAFICGVRIIHARPATGEGEPPPPRRDYLWTLRRRGGRPVVNRRQTGSGDLLSTALLLCPLQRVVYLSHCPSPFASTGRTPRARVAGDQKPSRYPHLAPSAPCPRPPAQGREPPRESRRAIVSRAPVRNPGATRHRRAHSAGAGSLRSFRAARSKPSYRRGPCPCNQPGAGVPPHKPLSPPR